MNKTLAKNIEVAIGRLDSAMSLMEDIRQEIAYLREQIVAEDPDSDEADEMIEQAEKLDELIGTVEDVCGDLWSLTD